MLTCECKHTGHDWEPVNLPFRTLFGTPSSDYCPDCGTVRVIVRPYRGRAYRRYIYRSFYPRCGI